MARFEIAPNEDNTGRSLKYDYKKPAYASSLTVKPNASRTYIEPAQLTGAMSIVATVTKCQEYDEIVYIFKADGTNRVVTFSTGHTTGGTLTVLANTSASVTFVFDGTGFIQKDLSSFTNGKVGTGATAINATATVTAAQLAGGLLTSTSAAAVTMTLPTATLLATELGAVRGTVFEFVVDNTQGANTVTVAVGSGITASGFPGTNTLTVPASATIGIATFRITFFSTTGATLARIS